MTIMLCQDEEIERLKRELEKLRQKSVSPGAVPGNLRKKQTQATSVESKGGKPEKLLSSSRVDTYAKPKKLDRAEQVREHARP